MCLLVQRQQAGHCASTSVQLEPAFEHCRTIFCFNLPLWILFLKLINVQVPANTDLKRSEESFSFAHFQGHMLTVLVLGSFQRCFIKLVVEADAACCAMRAVLADLGLWVCMAAPEHLPCLIHLALHPLVNKSLCRHGMLDMRSLGWWRTCTQGMVRFALR